MTSHVNELFEYRIVDSTNTLQSRGQLSARRDLRDPLAQAPSRSRTALQLDFYADHDNSGAYDRDLSTGRRPLVADPLTNDLLDENGAFVIAFDHNTSFSVLTSPRRPVRLAARHGSPRKHGAFMASRVECASRRELEAVVVLYRSGPRAARTSFPYPA